MPLLVAPTAYHGLAHPEGECETARGCRSGWVADDRQHDANRSLEEVAAAARWAALVPAVRLSRPPGVGASRAPGGGRGLSGARADGRYSAAWSARARHPQRIWPASAPAHGQFRGSRPRATGPGARRISGLAVYANALLDSSLTWEALDWLRSITTLPIVVKGILTAEDARLAVEHGARGIIVSNHGGRQLESGMATIEALPEVVAAAHGGAEVYLDGGIRRGTDALKALSLGARAVLLGRPILWGLAVSGQQGVARVLELLSAELELAMALVGGPSVAALGPALVRLPV